MKYFRRIEWFRTSEEIIAPTKADACFFPMDMGCATTDTGGCQLFDSCDIDNSNCSFSDECVLDYAAGCKLSDLCHTDGDGNCYVDHCTFDNGPCGMLDYHHDHY